MVTLWFYSEDEAPNFNADVGSNENSRFFMHKSKLLIKIEIDGVNRI